MSCIIYLMLTSASALRPCRRQPSRRPHTPATPSPASTATSTRAPWQSPRAAGVAIRARSPKRPKAPRSLSPWSPPLRRTESLASRCSSTASRIRSSRPTAGHCAELRSGRPALSSRRKSSARNRGRVPQRCSPRPRRRDLRRLVPSYRVILDQLKRRPVRVIPSRTSTPHLRRWNWSLSRAGPRWIVTL